MPSKVIPARTKRLYFQWSPYLNGSYSGPYTVDKPGVIASSYTHNTTANYRKVVPLPMYPMNREFRDFGFRSGYASSLYSSGPPQKLNFTATFLDPVGTYAASGHVVNSDQITRLKYNALIGCYNKLKNQNVSVGETAVEAKSTVKMILTTVGRLTSAARLIRKGNFVEASRKLGMSGVPRVIEKREHLANVKWKRKAIRAKRLGLPPPPRKVERDQHTFESDWLAYRYGWMPLYLTVYGAMVNTYDHYRTKQPIITIRHRALGKVGRTSVDYTGPTDVYAAANIGTNQKWITSINVQCCIRYQLTNNNLATATSFGLTNPALLAWELLPLSFVADWFVSISDVLSQVDNWVGKTFLSGCYTTREENRRDTIQRRYNISANARSFTPATCWATYLSIRREVFSTPPAVLPRLQLELNPQRIADAAALLRQALR